MGESAEGGEPVNSERTKKNARPAGGTARRAVETGTTEQIASLSTTNNSTKSGKSREGGIASLLLHGAENGLHLRDLCRLTGWKEREVRLQIHAERRRGIPILSDNVNGYFLPTDEQELVACVRSMRNRAGEILAAAEGIERSRGVTAWQQTSRN